MKGLAVLAVLVGAELVFMSADVFAQPAPPSPEIIARGVVSNVLQQARLRGPDNWQQLLQSIVVNFGELESAQPIARSTAGTRHIDMPSQFVRSQEGVLTIIHAGSGLVSTSGCAKGYYDYTKLQPFVPAVRYMQSNRANCQAALDRIPLSAAALDQVRKGLEAALLFGFVHEVGHHFHAHQPYLPPLPPSGEFTRCQVLESFRIRRLQEEQADDFAVDFLARVGAGTIVFRQAQVWLLSAMAESGKASSTFISDLELEFVNFHPFGARRLARQLRRTTLAEPPVEFTPLEKTWIRDFLIVDKKITELVEQSAFVKQQLAGCK